MRAFFMIPKVFARPGVGYACRETGSSTVKRGVLAGRRMGDRVSWETPAGERVMTITVVLKHALPA